MATHRIEIAEVVSFRLKLPQAALGRLVEELASEFPLRLANSGEDVFLRAAEGDSFLRFRPTGGDAVLTEVSVCKDLQGVFFDRVVASLLKEHSGDLHVRLVWNDSDRNVQGDFAEVIVQRGDTRYPEATPRETGNVVASAEAAGGLFAPLPEEDNGVQRLLAQADEHWKEYLRLKAARCEG